MACAALTNEDGIASCWLTPAANAGGATVTATADATGHWEGDSDTADFLVTPEETSLFFKSPVVQVTRDYTLTASAELREDGALTLTGRVVSFTLDGGGAQSDDGNPATVSFDDVEPGLHTIVATFTQDATHAGATLTQGVYLAGPQLVLRPLGSIGDAGATHSVEAVFLDDGGPISGKTVRYAVTSGPSSSATGSATTNSSGIATLSYDADDDDSGEDVLHAYVVLDGDSTQDDCEPSADASVFQHVLESVTLDVTPSASTVDYSDRFSATASLTDGSGNMAGAALKLDFDGQTCRGLTDSSGDLTCWFTVASSHAATPVTLTARFTGDESHEDATDTASVAVSTEETRLVFTGFTSSSATGGRNMTFTGRLTADGARGFSGATVTFSCGSYNGSGTTSSTGVVSATFFVANGTYTPSASFAGDNYYDSASATALSLTVSPSTPSSFSYNGVLSVPAAPTSVSASASGDHAVAVSFSSSSPTSPIRGYYYACTVGGTTRYVTLNASEYSASDAGALRVTGQADGGSGSGETIQVFAVNDVGTSSGSSTTGSANTTTIPAAPASVSRSAGSSAGQIDISWTGGDNGGVTLSSAGDVMSVLDGAVHSDVTSAHTWGSLSSGVPHAFRVRVKNSVGAGPWSDATAALPLGAAPSLPLDLVALPGNGTVTYYWRQPASLNGGHITHYEVRKDAASTPVTVDGNVVHRAFSGSNGTSMSVDVRAQNDFGWSGWTSPAVAATPATVPSIPAVVSGLPLNGAIEVTWTDGGNGGSELTGHLAHGAQSDISTSLDGPASATSASTVITGFANGHAVVPSMKAANALGLSTAKTSTGVTPARRSRQPLDVHVDSVGNGEATLSWTAPTGADIGGDHVGSCSISTDPPTAETPASSTSGGTVSSLENGQPYFFFVRCNNSELSDLGEESEAAGPAIPRTTPDAPRAFTVRISGDQKLMVSWLAPGDDGGASITNYRLHGEPSGCPSSIDPAPIAFDINDIGPFIRRRELTAFDPIIHAGCSYALTLKAENVAGAGAAAGPITIVAATLPQVAPDISGTPVIGDGTATVSFTGIVNDADSGWSDVIGYRACAIPGDATACVDVAADATEATLPDLQNGMSYRFEIRARNIVGLGPAATTEEAVIPCGPPAAPSWVTAHRIASGTLRVEWAEAFDNGCPVSYELDLDADGVADETISSGFEYEHSGLGPCDLHSYSVRAVNDAGPGEWSGPSIPVAASDPPSAPEHVILIPGDRCVMVRWVPGADACDPPVPLLGFNITVDSNAPIFVPADRNCFLLEGLSNTTAYDIEITALNDAGESDPGDLDNVSIVNPVTPAEPTISSVWVEPTTVAPGEWATFYVQLSGVSSPSGTTVTIVTEYDDVALPDLEDQVTECGEALLAIPVETFDGVSGTSILGAHIGSNPDTEALLTVGTAGSGGSTGTCAITMTVADSAGVIEDGGDVVDYGTTVTGLVDCNSSVAEWELQLCPADESIDCTLLQSGTGSVIDAEIDPTLLLNGEYLLCLTAYDSTTDHTRPDRVVAESCKSLTITGQQKIGNFTMSFNDMTIPAAGIPIQVIRTYDSRDKRDGDFGVGWQLSFNDVRVEHVRDLAFGWDLQTHGDLGAWGVTQTCTSESWAHVISVIFPDGKTYKFKPVLSNSQATPQPCQWWPPDVHSWVQFVPVGTTRGTLVPLGNNPGFDPRQVIIDPTYGAGDPPTPALYWDCATDDFNDSSGKWNPTEWSLTTEDGTTWVISETDGLESVTDRNGNWLEFNDTGITSSSGHDVSIERNTSGHVTRIFDPASNWTEYCYSSTSHLINFADRQQHNSDCYPSAYTHFSYDDTSHPNLVTLVQQYDGSSLTTAPPYSVTSYGADGRITEICRHAGSDVDCLDMAAGRDLVGHQQVVPDLRGFTTTYTYDGRGNVTDREDALGNPWHTEYNAEDQPTLERDPLGHETTYEYDAEGNVSSVTNELSESTGYTWGPKQTLLTLTPPGMGPTTFEYDDKGNLLLTRDALNHETVSTPDGAGNTAYTRNALGYETFATWQGGDLLDETAAGVTTHYDHDDNGNVTITSRFGADAAESTQQQYDLDGRPTRTAPPGGGITETVYDNYGRPWKMRELVTADDPDTTTNEESWRETVNVYDAYGHLTMVWYPDGTATRTTFDDAGNAIQEESRVPRSFPTGTPSDLSDLPLVTRTGYDALGRPYKTCHGGGAAIEDAEAWEAGCTWSAFDDAGRNIAQVDERGYITLTEYDDADRPTRTCGPFGPFTDFSPLPTCDSTGAEPDVLTHYDDAGRVAWVKAPDTAYAVSHYDALGRREWSCKQLDPDDGPDDPTMTSDDEIGVTCKHFEFDAIGRLVAATDEDGHRTEYAHDEAGHLLSVTDANGGLTQYEYDSLGRMRFQTDAMEHVTEFQYDSAGHRAARILPLLHREDFRYGLTGALTSHVDFMRRTTAHDNDPDNDRLLATDFPNDPAETFEYYGDGTRKSATVGSDTIEYGRNLDDGFGALGSVDRPDGPALDYGYEFGRRTRTTVDDGTPEDMTFEYNAAGQMSAAIDSDGARVDYAYDGSGRLLTETYSEGTTPRVSGTRTYDPLTGALTTLVWDTVPHVPDSLPLLSIAYELDDADDDDATPAIEGSGRRTGFDEQWRDGSVRHVDYGFDALNRLVHESYSDGVHAWAISYTYDEVGNRLTRTVSGDVPGGVDGSHAYGSDANDRLVEIDGEQQAWNGNGDFSKNDYEWDDRDRLKVADGWNFTYDVDGLKESFDSPEGPPVTQVVDASFPYAQVLEDRDGTTVQARYLRGLYPVRLTLTGIGSWWFLHDALGSTRALVSSGESPSVTDQWDYEGFGATTRQSVTSDGGAANRWMFAGEERRNELGLDFLRARWLEPASGSFATSDSWVGGMRGGHTLPPYVYASSSPVDRIDPGGHFDLASTLAATYETLQTISIAVNLVYGVKNSAEAILCGMAATRAARNGQAFEAIGDAAAGVIHGVIAAFCFAGAGAGINAPPLIATPPTTSLMVVGGGRQFVTQILTANPAAAKWLAGEVVPIVLAMAADGSLPPEARPPRPMRGSFKPGSKAGECDKYMLKAMADNDGATKLLAPKGNHWAALLRDGHTVIDPTLYDNLEFYGADVSDLDPLVDTYELSEWRELCMRFPVP